LKNLVFTWLLVFGIIAGLNLRVFVTPGGCSSICPQTQCHPCDHQDTLPADHDHDGPVEHHHHECCIHMLPLTVERDSTIVLLVPVCTTPGLRPESEVPPDAPFLSSEKPPLI